MKLQRLERMARLQFLIIFWIGCLSDAVKNTFATGSLETVNWCSSLFNNNITNKMDQERPKLKILVFKKKTYNNFDWSH